MTAPDSISFRAKDGGSPGLTFQRRDQGKSYIVTVPQDMTPDQTGCTLILTHREARTIMHGLGLVTGGGE